MPSLIRHIFFFLILAALCATDASAQQKKSGKGKSRKATTTQVAKPKTGPDRVISGWMLDSYTDETLPFSNVYVRGSLIGTQTDMDGFFKVSVPARYDTLRFSAMGFKDEFRLVDDLAKQMRHGDSIIIKLKPDNLKIDEVLVKPDDKPYRLLRAVVRSKPKNDPTAHQRADYEKYTRWEYSLANISDRAAEKGLILKGAKDLMQISPEDSTRYLPVYFSETLSHNETQADPLKARTTILADRTRGIDVFKQYEIGGFSNALDNEINFYDDVVKMLGVGFVSPIAAEGPRYYDYFIIDSALVKNRVRDAAITPEGVDISGIRCANPDSTRLYTVKFRPKNVGDKVFEGTMVIETGRFSPLKIDAKMPKGTNINFVKKLNIKSSFQLVGDSIPFFGTNEMEVHVDYMPVNSDKKRLEILCRMINSQSDVKLDSDTPLELSKKALDVETLKTDDYKNRDDEFWDERRHTDMTIQERKANAMIDSLNNVTSIKAFNHLAKAAITGFVDVGTLEIGPIGEMFNTNKIEGLHLGYGMRTSKEISEQWVVSGILGYGFKNTRVTYGAGLGYRFTSPMRRTLELDYSDRLMKIGEDENILYLYENMLSTSETNIVAQLFKREEIDELLYCQKIRLRYDNEWFTGFQTRLQAIALWQESPKYYPFTQGGQEVSTVKQQEVTLDFRFSWREKFMDDGLQRMYLTTYHPILHFTVGAGRTEAGSKSSTYARLHTTVKHTFYLGQTKLNLAVEDGVYFGKLPYSVLNIARGNKTYGFYRYDFNLMNYLQFVCDKYVYVHADYQMDGLLLHKLPAVYKLGLREVVGAKMMFGSLSDRHAQMLDMPEGVGGPTKPYIELNVGLDNILRFFRVDYVHRVCGDDFGDSPKWGFRVQFQLKL